MLNHTTNELLGHWRGHHGSSERLSGNAGAGRPARSKLPNTLNAELAPFESFVLPAGTELAAHSYSRRWRAERSVLAVQRLPSHLSNRLSEDLLFILARSANLGTKQPLWKPGSS